MRNVLSIVVLLLAAMTSNAAQLIINIGSPSLRIGVNVSDYPDLVAIPGYPVYYAPQMESNYFFYDGLYWVYDDDSWYTSSWYDGPWSYVNPNAVPLYILRVPVRYYRRPPVYFHNWSAESAPRWGEHWGNDWQERRRGWDNWDHRRTPRASPLPSYQRQYSGTRYPDTRRQRAMQKQHYSYQPQSTIAARYYKNEREQSDRARVQSQQQNEREVKDANERRQQARRQQEQQEQQEQQQSHQLEQRQQQEQAHEQVKRAEQQAKQNEQRQQANQQQAQQDQRTQQNKKDIKKDPRQHQDERSKNEDKPDRNNSNKDQNDNRK